MRYENKAGIMTMIAVAVIKLMNPNFMGNIKVATA
jgi:hypothetical protein